MFLLANCSNVFSINPTHDIIKLPQFLKESSPIQKKQELVRVDKV